MLCCVQLDHTQDQRGVDFATEHITFDADIGRSNISDWEFAIRNDAQVDHHPGKTTGKRQSIELAARSIKQCRDMSRKDCFEIQWVGIEVLPFKTQIVQAELQPCGQIERSTVQSVDDQFTLKRLAFQCRQRSIFFDSEVVRCAFDVQRACLDSGSQ